MAPIPVWKQPQAERAATFDAVFANIPPAERAMTNARAQLRAVESQIIRKRAEGYNIEQIAAAMKDPRIGIDVTASYIGKILKDVARRREKRRKARLAAIIAAAERKPAPAPAATAARPPAMQAAAKA